jgi:hypothetical protein
MATLSERGICDRVLYIEIANTSPTFSVNQRSVIDAKFICIFLRFGHGFELPLLAQSVVMIAAMLVMVRLCVDVKNRTQIIKGKERVITGEKGVVVFVA